MQFGLYMIGCDSQVLKTVCKNKIKEVAEVCKVLLDAMPLGNAACHLIPLLMDTAMKWDHSQTLKSDIFYTHASLSVTYLGCCVKHFDLT